MKTRNCGYDVSQKVESVFTDYPITLQPVTLNSKLKSTGAGRYQLLSRWWDVALQAAWPERLSPKSQDAVALQQIKERGALPMIDRGDGLVGQSTVAAISGLHCRALLWLFEHEADSLIAKFEEGRNGRVD